MDLAASFHAPAAPAAPAALRAACSSCKLRELCLPVGALAGELERLDALAGARAQLKRGESLFRTGDRFEFLYAVRVGFFKSSVFREDGREQVTGFHMTGELLGLDGIGSERHTCETVALETSQVCVIPFDRLEAIAREVPSLQRQLHRIMSREIVREQGVMLLLGGMRAEERVAAFVINLTERLRDRGFSGSALVLRMTREEIGSYLGLTLETVSRAFSKFQAQGLLAVRHRHVQIRDEAGLRRLVGPLPA